tara:strand:+ start:9030 stop:9884 length:855 start_codon:yes stop_codon:yes gene_type:complete
MASLFVNELTNIDFSYLDPHRGVVGESWYLDVQLYGDLDEQGMVFDFGLVKKVIRQYVDDSYDHKLWVPTSYTGCTVEKESNDYCRVTMPLSNGGHITHYGPSEAVALFNEQSLTKSIFAKRLEAELLALLPDNVKEIRTFLREEEIESAYYHYTHGLQKHQGNCQRIAHGHRSRIEVQLNGERCLDTENALANTWQDIYIATESHIESRYTDNGINYLTIGYTAPQGRFELSLPACFCQVIPYDSTVELIAKYLAEYLKKNNPGNSYKVKAFEGIKKGAIAFA